MRTKKYTIISFIFWSIFIAFGISTFRKGGNNNKAVQQNELTSIVGTLENQPTIQKSKSGPHVPIKVKEYPGFVFNVGGVNYTAFNEDFTSEVMKGDTIHLYILTHDYDTKIDKKKHISFSEQVITYKFIEPYAIHSNGKFYMKLEDTNREIEHNRWLGFWFFSTGALFFLLYSILYWTGSLRRFAIWWNHLQAGG